VNKQLNDKERVAAALENDRLLGFFISYLFLLIFLDIINNCISHSD